MDQKQSFNLSADFFGGFTSVFVKLVFAIIVVYLLVMVINFLRDKFINKEASKPKDDIYELLAILGNLFYISGFGFVIANVFQFILSRNSGGHGNMSAMVFRGEWEYLTFGIILFFVGIGLQVGKRVLRKNRTE